MSKLQTLIKNKQSRYKQNGVKEVFKKEDGAIDLASIMVGVIVIGMIGGVIAATVFAVIPWTQDNAAKQQLDSIVQAENAYFGLSSANPSPLPVGHKTNSFGKSAELANAKLLSTGARYCVTTPDDGKSYTGYSQSSSGTIFTVTDKNSKPQPFAVPAGSTATDSLPSDCKFITEGFEGTSAPSAPSVPYVDPTPTLTKLTYQCDITTTGKLPFGGAIRGTEAWNDGTSNTTYPTPVSSTNNKTLTAGQEYTVTFDGTYTSFISNTFTKCLKSVDHWGANTGVTSANAAFDNATKLTKVPAHIPSTITNMTYMFRNATSFNDPNVRNWNVSNVKDMVMMFKGANAFNQDLGSWDTSKVRAMGFMFGDAFNMKNNVKHNTYNTATIFTFQCDTTTTGKLPTQTKINITESWSDGYSNTNYFVNSDIDAPNDRTLTAGQEYTAVVEGTFSAIKLSSLTKCLKSVDHWGSNTGVTTVTNAFDGATKLTNIPDNIPTTITNMTSMFKGATAFNDPDISKWDVTNITNMTRAFEGATSFNQPLNNWNVAKVTDMSFMFQNAPSFNQPLNNWNVSTVTNMVMMFKGSDAFNQDLGSWDTSKVKRMGFMFGDAFSMKNNVKHNTYNTTTTLTLQCDTTITSRLPMSTKINAAEAWSDGFVDTRYFVNSDIDYTNDRTLTAGKEYIVVFEGTYEALKPSGLTKCLKSVDHIGSATGLKAMTNAFDGATKLTNVPEDIPTTITNMSTMFRGATSFNDSDISNWNVSNVTTMIRAFEGATSFNQPLNNWNVSKVTDMSFMFQNTFNFNQPLNNWDVSNVKDMVMMFKGANAFNQDLGSWNTSKVRAMGFMFGDAFIMKNNIKHNTYNTTTTLTFQCDTTTTGKLPMNNNINAAEAWSDGFVDTTYFVNSAISNNDDKTLTGGQEYTVVFEGTYTSMRTSALTKCLKSVDHWGSNTGVTNAYAAFDGALKLTNIPSQIPLTINNMQYMFRGTTNFNDPDIKNWDVSKVTNMSYMFANATSFNQDLKSSWNTAALSPANGTFFAPASFPDAYMPANTSK